LQSLILKSGVVILTYELAGYQNGKESS